MMKMIPILITTCIPSTIIAQTTTLFIRQGTITDTCAPFLSASTRTSAITACYLCHFLFCPFHLPFSLSLSLQWPLLPPPFVLLPSLLCLHPLLSPRRSTQICMASAVKPPGFTCSRGKSLFSRWVFFFSRFCFLFNSTSLLYTVLELQLSGF